MNRVSHIEKLVRLPLDKMGYDLVRVSLEGDKDICLQIMAERADRAEMTVKDCSLISRELSPLLDEKNPIDSAYTLEVSSPGIDRPLVQLADYERFVGYQVRLECRKKFSGQKSVEGILVGIEGDCVVMSSNGQSFVIPFEYIQLANLVLTDRLLRSGANT
ncbi:MAG: ribosome maturation factor RimP [Pseudomonadota bacterium]|nr:ribosome maturation factor RimP [Pseudomonadota bacterium]